MGIQDDERDGYRLKHLSLEMDPWNRSDGFYLNDTMLDTAT